MVSHHRNNRKMENLNLLKSDIIKKFGITASHHIGNLENPILKSNLWFLVRNPTSYILKDSPMGNFVQNTHQREEGKKKVTLSILRNQWKHHHSGNRMRMVSLLKCKII